MSGEPTQRSVAFARWASLLLVVFNVYILLFPLAFYKVHVTGLAGSHYDAARLTGPPGVSVLIPRRPRRDSRFGHTTWYRTYASACQKTIHCVYRPLIWVLEKRQWCWVVPDEDVLLEE